MICPACQKAADTGELLLHDQCDGKTQCDCQHGIPKRVPISCRNRTPGKEGSGEGACFSVGGYPCLGCKIGEPLDNDPRPDSGGPDNVQSS